MEQKDLRYIGALEQSPEPGEAPACTRYKRCLGCPYPGHGFICWGSDEECLWTLMSKLSRKPYGPDPAEQRSEI